MDFHLYSIRNTVSNKWYIGQTKQTLKKRLNEHKYLLRNNRHKNSHLQASWNKHGEAAFVFSEIRSSIKSHEELDFLEWLYIEIHDTKSPNGYNLTEGGRTHTWSPESRQKQSEKKKGNKNPRFGLPGTMLGKSQSASARQKMSVAKTGKALLKKRKPIECTTTGEVFDSAKSASKKFNIKPSAISRVANGQRTHVHKLKFKYV